MRPTQEKDFTLGEEVLAVSLELSKGSWKVALHDGKRDKPAIHAVSSEAASTRLGQVGGVIEATRKKWGLGCGLPRGGELRGGPGRVLDSPRAYQARL
jgi:transposase